jgi:peptidoglycan/xylan/chitin deacetylase (PgdA/CDA1 family)
MKEEAEDRRESRSRFRRVGLFLPAIAILGIAGPMLIFILMMQINGWQSPKLGIQGFFGFAARGSTHVYLYASTTSQQYLKQIGGNYDTLLKPWRDYFSDRRLSYEEVVDAQRLNALSDGVLVVPSALSLNDTERQAIQSFRAKGGGVLVTWATGTRSGSGDWAGWQLLDSLGAKVVGEMPPESESRQLTLNGASPVSHQLDAGTRIWMGKTRESLLRMKGDAIAARFMDWPRIPEQERKDEAAITYSETTPQAGRAVVFGFAETAWESRPFFTRILIDDTLQWLRREPSLVKAAWPNGKQGAQVIEMDSEQGFENTAAFAEMMRSVSYKATFYVLTSVGIQFPDILKGLARDFDVGYHGDVHVSFKQQPEGTQEQRIIAMQADMRSVLADVKRITGFRAPTEGYDTTTEKLLQKHGIRHHAADPSRLEGRLPAVVKMDGVPLQDALIVIPRTQRDDINLFWEKFDANQLSQALIDDFDLALSTGALAFLSVHSQNFGPDSTLRQAMPALLAHIQKVRGKLFMASSSEVAQWWRDRERVAVSSVPSGKRLDFNITVKGDEPVSGMSLTLMLPQKGLLPTIRSTKIGTLVPSVQLLDDYRASVLFDKLEPGDYVFQATFVQ